MTIGIIYREELKEYDFGSGHSFRGDRYQLFAQFLRDNIAEDNSYQILRADPATDRDLLLICGKEYIKFTKEYYRAANLGLSYPGNFDKYHGMDNKPIERPGKLEEAARLIIGQAKMACDMVQLAKFSKVVSIGGGMHHAKRSYGDGFCIYNDVAFCALYLMREYELESILILDTDAHAGNGTCEYFYDDPRVLFIDLHQDPRTLYPGTGFANQIGLANGKGFTVNIPMPVNAGYDSYQLAFKSIVEPMTQEFKPQIIIRNGGSDPHLNDGLTSLGLPIKGFRMIGERVRQMAQVCDEKVIDLIASGYNNEILPYAWLALISGLAGIETEIEKPETIPSHFSEDTTMAETAKVIEEVKDNLQEYWVCLR